MVTGVRFMINRGINVSVKKSNSESLFIAHVYDTFSLKGNIDCDISNCSVSLMIVKPDDLFYEIADVKNMTVEFKDSFFDVPGVYKGQYKFTKEHTHCNQIIKDTVKSTIFYFVVHENLF